jgi:hypothetical protein
MLNRQQHKFSAAAEKKTQKPVISLALSECMFLGTNNFSARSAPAGSISG